MKQKSTAAVLIYQLPPFTAQGQAVRHYLSSRGIRAITVTAQDGGKSIATLLGLQQDAPVPFPPLPGEAVLVLYGLVGPVFDDFLDFLQKTAPVRLKAVATPFNLRWSFGRLAAHLREEA